MTSKMNLGYSFVFILCHIGLLSTLAEDDNVLQYSSDTFDSSVKSNNHFVMFYSPTCGRSKRLLPIWKQLADMVNSERDSQITIAKVDCIANGGLCWKHNVTGYPTVEFFRRGSLEGVKFRGARDLPSLTSFMNEQLGTIRGESVVDSERAETNEGLTELTEATFETTTNSGNHFVKFYAPWCGHSQEQTFVKCFAPWCEHCKRLAPTWSELNLKVKDSSKVRLARVDCTQPDSKELCNEQEVRFMPPEDLWGVEDQPSTISFECSRRKDKHLLYARDKRNASTATNVNIIARSAAPSIGPSRIFLLNKPGGISLIVNAVQPQTDSSGS